MALIACKLYDLLFLRSIDDHRDPEEPCECLEGLCAYYTRSDSSDIHYVDRRVKRSNVAVKREELYQERQKWVG